MDDFDAAFCALTGNPPFPWQRALYEKWFALGEFPNACTLPTGLGKTSVVAVWLLALAANPERVPRRLVYVVNRRTVVDQTTAEVEKYRERLLTLPTILDQLRGLCAVDKPVVPYRPEPLALSTLRGQFADNREWSGDPARPAVVVGTVDMIGSRLLFSGYGLGMRTRPLHAGFLGQDALLVHDEAHLEKPFQDLVRAIETEQKRCSEWKPLRVIELTATSRGHDSPPFALSAADYENEMVRKRIEATKILELTQNQDEKKLAEEIAAAAVKRGKQSPGTAIIVFVRSVEDVDKVTKKLPASAFEKLTGTLRGFERDRLVRTPIFQRFLPPSNRAEGVTPTEGTVFLVCTSAGEVGVNISADHLVCDLSTFESMAQRFGRVNRFGERDDTRIDVLHPPEAKLPSAADEAAERKKEKQNPWVFVDAARRRTLALLHGLKKNASPAALGALDAKERETAFTPPPTILPTSDILFDAWALTTIHRRLPGRPRIEPYLHGRAGWEPPETRVAWRAEVGVVVGPLLAQHDPTDLLADYPLKPHELLRDRTDRVFKQLEKIRVAGDTPVWLMDDEGEVTPTKLYDVIDAGKDALAKLTVLLPPSAGGLENGLLSGDSAHTTATRYDVADDWFADDAETVHRRVRVYGDDERFEAIAAEYREVTHIDLPSSEDDEDAEGRTWFWFERPRDGDGEGSTGAKKPVLWSVHTEDVSRNATATVAKLPLPDELKRLVIRAAEWHDLGKKRAVFQRVLGNFRRDDYWLAKSGKKGGKLAETYRHEFGSLLDTADDNAFPSLGADERELVLHLIAAHHGRGRPHFPAAEAFDPERQASAAADVTRVVPQRYARLQRKYGRWGLAYLESLLRAADYAASANPSKYVEGDGS